MINFKIFSARCKIRDWKQHIKFSMSCSLVVKKLQIKIKNDENNYNKEEATHLVSFQNEMGTNIKFLYLCII